MIKVQPEAIEARRRWWAEYARVLRAPVSRRGSLDELSALTGELVAAGLITAGLITAGCPMSRDGCEDIAAECDRLRKLI